MTRERRVDIAALELFEASLAVDGASQEDFLAGAPFPVAIRRLALEMRTSAEIPEFEEPMLPYRSE